MKVDRTETFKVELGQCWGTTLDVNDLPRSSTLKGDSVEGERDSKVINHKNRQEHVVQEGTTLYNPSLSSYIWKEYRWYQIYIWV